jgi:hypothetical protein
LLTLIFGYIFIELTAFLIFTLHYVITERYVKGGDHLISPHMYIVTYMYHLIMVFIRTYLFSKIFYYFIVNYLVSSINKFYTSCGKKIKHSPSIAKIDKYTVEEVDEIK